MNFIRSLFIDPVNTWTHTQNRSIREFCCRCIYIFILFHSINDWTPYAESRSKGKYSCELVLMCVSMGIMSILQITTKPTSSASSNDRPSILDYVCFFFLEERERAHDAMCFIIILFNSSHFSIDKVRKDGFDIFVLIFQKWNLILSR